MYDKTSSGIETPGTNDAATLTNGWNYNTEIESLDTHKPSTHCLDLWAASPLEHIEGPFESRRLHRQTAIDPKAIQKIVEMLIAWAKCEAINQRDGGQL
jgi:hypothetical protein